MTDQFNPATHPHRRRKQRPGFSYLGTIEILTKFLVNPLTGEYILVSPQRNTRPWQGQVEASQPVTSPQYDAKCFLCPGNKRDNGQRNEIYEHTTVFDNDYAAVLPPPIPIAPAAPHPLLTTQPVHGQCDVVTFHPRHDLTLARLAVEDITRIVEEWIAIYKRRGTQEGIKYVQIFEVSISLSLVPTLLAKSIQNKGAMMGCSNPHPHGQVWSLSEVPNIPSLELASLARYALNPDISPTHAPLGPFGRPCLLCEYVHFEVGVAEGQSRVVVKNEHFVALVPWWATWPFEILCKNIYYVLCSIKIPISASPPSTHSVTAPSHRGREVVLCKHTILGYQALRQPLLMFIRVLYGYPSKAYPSKGREYR